MTTIAEALAQARVCIAPSEAKLLLRHVLGCTSVDIAAHPERMLDECQASRYVELVACRAAGEPIAYMLGVREFFGREFRVTPAVLIPRPETELLVEVALAKFGDMARPRILDLGAGSGCVAITLALEADADVTAADISTDALAVARDNAARLGASVNFIESDWFSAVAGKFDLIVGNPPYIVEGDAHLAQGDLRFEPPQALASGADGLDAIRHIVAEALRYLIPGGWLFLEHGYDQAEAMLSLLSDAGFTSIEQHRDLAGIVRVSGGCLDRSSGPR